jgi:hypothetical protein
MVEPVDLVSKLAHRVTCYRLADQWIVLSNSGTADGTHPVQPSADPKNLIAESQDETIPVSL